MTEFGGGAGFFPPFPPLGGDTPENPLEEFIGKVEIAPGIFAYITKEKDALPPIASFELNLDPLKELLNLDDFEPEGYDDFANYIPDPKDEVRRFVSEESIKNFIKTTGFQDGVVYYDYDNQLWIYVFKPT